MRQVAELAYTDFISNELPQDEFLGEMAAKQLIYYPTVTREPYKNRGRLTDLIRSGQIFTDIDMPELNLEDDRVMLCGSPEMLAETKQLLEERGFKEGSQSEAGHFVIEKAFVEK